MQVLSKNTTEATAFLTLLKQEPVKQILKGVVRGFVVGYGIQATFKTVFGILFGHILRKPELLMDYLGRSSVNFGLFLGSFNGLFRIIYYLLSILQQNRNKNEGMKIFIAGTLAGTSMFLDNRDRWSDIGIYMFARACAALAGRLYDKNFMGVQTSQNILMILIRDHLDTFIFCLSCCVIMSTFIYRPDFFPRGYYKLFQTIEGSDREITGNWRRRFRRYYHTFFRSEEERIAEEEKLRQRAIREAQQRDSKTTITPPQPKQSV